MRDLLREFMGFLVFLVIIAHLFPPRGFGTGSRGRGWDHTRNFKGFPTGRRYR
jgi:hypothetical protein